MKSHQNEKWFSSKWNVSKFSTNIIEILSRHCLYIDKILYKYQMYSNKLPLIRITRRTTGARGCKFWTILKHFELYRTIWNYLGLSGTISDYHGLSRTFSDYLGLPWTIGLSRTISEYLILPQTILDYLGLFQNILDYLRISRSF